MVRMVIRIVNIGVERVTIVIRFIYAAIAVYIQKQLQAGAQSRLRQLDCKYKFSQMDISLKLIFSLVCNLASHLRVTYMFSPSKTTLDGEKIGSKKNIDEKIWTIKMLGPKIWIKKIRSKKCEATQIFVQQKIFEIQNILS